MKKPKLTPEQVFQRFAAEEAAEKRGADELMNLCEFKLSSRPRALSNARKIYKQACLELYRCLEEARQ